MRADARAATRSRRPFTLVAPALGFVSGAVTAVGAAPREAWHPRLLVYPLIGSSMAALLNAGNNALNQIYDLEIDRVNKPKRPLPSGRLSMRAGLVVHHRHLRARAGARLAGRARRPPRMLLARRRRRRLHLHLFGAAAPDQAAGHLGQRHDRDSARRAAEGRGLVVGEDDRRRSSRGTSARSSACSSSAPRRRRTSRTWKATRAAAAARCRSCTACGARPG